MKTDNRLLIILNTIESFFTAWAFMKAGRMEPGNILTGVFFLLSFFLYRHISVRLSIKPFVYTKHVRWSAIVLSFLFTVFYMAIDYPHYIETLTNRLFQAVVLLSVFLGFCCCFLTAPIKIRCKDFYIKRKKAVSAIFHFTVFWDACSAGCLISCISIPAS